MSNVLVTGGAGFIGSHVASELIKRGYSATVLDDLSGGFRENVPIAAEFVQGSVNDVALVDRLFAANRFDYVYHLAAYAAENLSHYIKRFNYENNLIGSVNLINASINTGVKCFVFTSSIAVYGNSPELPMTEAMTPRPEDPYGIAKYAVEQELRVSHDFFGLDYIIFRPHNVYGERQNIRDPYRNVVAIFMRQIMSGEPMTIYGDGEQTRAFSYIGDVAPLMARASQNPVAHNQIFNIGADYPRSINDLAIAVAITMGVEPRIVHLPERREVKNAYSSHDKLRLFFGSHKAHSIENGLSRMARWVKSANHHPGHEIKEMEIAWRS